MSKYYWVIDLDRCIGCESCVIGCKQMHQSLPDIQYRRVHKINPEQYPDHPILRISIACNHCEKPACLKGCPVNAYSQSEGIVEHEQKKCIGCKYCLWLCPYDAPRFSKAKGKVEKCNLCPQQLHTGFQIDCVKSCPTKALKLVENLKELGDQQDFLSNIVGFPTDKTHPKLRMISNRRVSSNKGGKKR